MHSAQRLERGVGEEAIGHWVDELLKKTGDL